MNTYTGYSDCFLICMNSETVLSHANLNIRDMLQGDNVMIAWPNPSFDIVSLKASISSPFEIINASGQIVGRGDLEANEVATQDLSGYPAGIYTIRLNLADRVVTQRVVKN